MSRLNAVLFQNFCDRLALFYFVGLMPFQPIRTIAEVWDAGHRGGGGGGDSGPGRNGRRPAEAAPIVEGSLPVHEAAGAHPYR